VPVFLAPIYTRVQSVRGSGFSETSRLVYIGNHTFGRPSKAAD
jgi:hypothetical protein